MNAVRHLGGRRLLTAASVVLLLLGVAAVVIGLTRQQHPPAVQPAGSSAAAAPPAVAGPAAPTSPDATTEAPAAPPVRVQLGRLGIDAPVIPLGLNPDGSLAVPSGPDETKTGWYTGSPAPGMTGPTVLEGHVDLPGGIRGPFWELSGSRVGDTVTVTRSDHRAVTYRIYRVAVFDKTAFPTDDVYGNTAGPEVRLITCGGTFDPVRHYPADVVAYGQLA